MENIYNQKLQATRQLLKKVNPLSIILPEEHLRSILDDILSISFKSKNEIRTMFKRWTVKNHPDKWGSNEDAFDKEIAYSLIQVFGDVITKCNRPSNDDVWVFMRYSANAFHDLNIDHLNIDDIKRVQTSIDTMMSLCIASGITPIIISMIESIRNNFEFFETFHSMECVCMIHSTEESVVEKQNCPPCNPIIVEDDSDDDVFPLVNENDSNGDREEVVPEEERDDVGDVGTNIDADEGLNIRRHRKRRNPTCIRIHISAWSGCLPNYVSELPRDINGLKIYILSFDPMHRMRSSRDARKWKRYITSARKEYDGMRRLADCKNCKGVRKIWEFDDINRLVTIYHYGMHHCNIH